MPPKAQENRVHLPAADKKFLRFRMLNMSEKRFYNRIQFWKHVDVASHIEDLMKSIYCELCI